MKKIIICFQISALFPLLALGLIGCGQELSGSNEEAALSADGTFLGTVYWVDELGQQQGFHGELIPTATGISIGLPKEQSNELNSERAFSVLSDGKLVPLRCNVGGQKKYCRIGGQWVVCGCDAGSGNISANNCTWSESGC